MSSTYDFDRLVEGWLQSESPREMSAAALDEALRSARRLPQRRGVRAWFAGSGAWPAERQFGALAVPNGLRLALVLALLLSAVVLAALVGARLLAPDPVPPGALVYATDGGLFIANADGSNPKAIRTDGPYRDPRWSPAGDTIAVLHGLPASGDPAPLGYELLMVRPDGVVTGRVDLGGTQFPGGYEWLPTGAGERDLLALTNGLHGEQNGLIAPTSVVDRTGAVLLQNWEGLTGIRLKDEREWTATSPDAGRVPVLVYSASLNGVDGIYAFDPSLPGDGLGRLITPLVPLGGSALPEMRAIAVSPAGTDVAFVELDPDKGLDGTLFVAPVAGGGARTRPCHRDRASNVALVEPGWWIDRRDVRGEGRGCRGAVQHPRRRLRADAAVHGSSPRGRRGVRARPLVHRRVPDPRRG